MNEIISNLLKVGFEAVRHWASNGAGNRNAIQCLRTEEIRLPGVHARDCVRDLLRRLGFRLQKDEDGTELYSRGDQSVRELPCSRSVEFREIPTYLGFSCVSIGEGVLFTLMAKASPRVKFHPPVNEQFESHLRELCAAIFQLLTDVAGDYASANSTAGDRRSDTATSNLHDELTDLAELGLAAGATWEQVQTAFRAACNKYHPDRLVGQQVAPHLIDLAAERFKVVNQAYQRLKGRVRAS